jgi:hypothetical protein
MRTPKILLIAATLIIAISGCKKEVEESDNTTLISRHNETKSHNNDKACQSCHSIGGSGEGWFGIAGSVSTQDLSSPNPNGTLYLYSGPSGTGNLLATVEVDGNGNFFTTAASIAGSGAYAQLKSASGNTKNMSLVITSGNCNSCHGVSTGKIWVN